MSLSQINFQEHIEYVEEGKNFLYSVHCFFSSFLVLRNYSSSKCSDILPALLAEIKLYLRIVYSLKF